MRELKWRGCVTVRDTEATLVVNGEVNKYHLIVRGLFPNFKAPTITKISSLCSLIFVIVGALKLGNKPLTIRKYLFTSPFTT